MIWIAMFLVLGLAEYCTKGATTTYWFLVVLANIWAAARYARRA